MKFIATFPDFPIQVSETYKDIVAAVAVTLSEPETRLNFEPDPIDGNQYEKVFVGSNDFASALIFTEEQYDRRPANL